ncbi:XdhC/CoxI family protein [Streptomyces sp. B6B3]|uniref:XdhC/CoxI family protein n=1 Tax=Streptomyces sp. B6B3 TaxID=3153570 RepID=UPI00325F84E8
MLDIADELRGWLRDGRDFAVATVVATRGSAPRRAGAALAVDAAGDALGSVSGGCVEGAVYELCGEALRQGGAPLVERYRGDQDDPFAAGLTCGGDIEVLVTPVRGGAAEHPALAAALDAAATGRATALVRVVAGPSWAASGALAVTADGAPVGTLGGGAGPDRAAATAAAGLLREGRTGTVELPPEPSPERLTLFVESRLPPPRLLVYGAVDFAGALVRVGRLLGYRVTVCDARPVFATPARFPEADEVVADWPHRHLDAEADAGRLDDRTVVCVLTHDPKFDVPLLRGALRLPVGYVGAMGSRRTHADRLRRLREAGVTDAELAALRSPIGLDLGAHTPEETALSIAGEIVAVRRGGSGLPLTGTDTPIHPAHTEDSAGDAAGRGCRWRDVGSGHDDDSRPVAA